MVGTQFSVNKVLVIFVNLRCFYCHCVFLEFSSLVLRGFNAF
jgi:hypothetical protein